MLNGGPAQIRVVDGGLIFACMRCTRTTEMSTAKRMEVENVTEKGKTYVCEICGNKVQVLEAGAGNIVCCGHACQLAKA